MIGIADEHDLPPGAAIFSKNLDVATQDGAFAPLPTDDPQSLTVTAQWMTQLEDGETIIYSNGDTVYKIVDLSTSPVVSSVGTVAGWVSGGNTHGVSDGEAAHIGMGSDEDNPSQWVGNIYNTQFESSGNDRTVPVGLVMEDAQLVSSGCYDDATLTLNNETDTSDNVAFETGNIYFWYVSCVYDGIQESPLTLLGQEAVFNTDQTGGYLGWEDASFTLRCVEANPPSGRTIFSQRITRINIYRASAPSASATVPASDYFLVESIDPNKATGWTTYSAGGGETGWEYTVTDTLNFLGSFETRTGFSPTLEHMNLNYGLSCTSESYHIIADVWHEDLKDVPNYLFRSKSHRFDTFDWSNDYLILPQRPTALVSFLGNIYAFCEGRTFVISTSAFTIEEEINGIGCYSNKSVSVTDYGMFWADARNLYHHDGNKINVIGRDVLDNRFNSDAGYLNHVVNSTIASHPLVMYDPRYDSAVFYYQTALSGYSSHGLLYHPSTKRWGYITPPENNYFGGAIHGIDGISYYMHGSEIYTLFTGSSYRTWSWVSRNLVPSLATKVRFHYAYMHHDTASYPTLVYWENDPEYADSDGDDWTNTSVETTNVVKGQINTGTPPAWTYARNMQVGILDAAGTVSVNKLSIRSRVLTPR